MIRKNETFVRPLLTLKNLRERKYEKKKKKVELKEQEEKNKILESKKENQIKLEEEKKKDGIETEDDDIDALFKDVDEDLNKQINDKSDNNNNDNNNNNNDNNDNNNEKNTELKFGEKVVEKKENDGVNNSDSKVIVKKIDESSFIFDNSFIGKTLINKKYYKMCFSSNSFSSSFTDPTQLNDLLSLNSLNSFSSSSLYSSSIFNLIGVGSQYDGFVKPPMNITNVLDILKE
jgi:hypothetical protein